MLFKNCILFKMTSADSDIEMLDSPSSIISDNLSTSQDSAVESWPRPSFKPQQLVTDPNNEFFGVRYITGLEMDCTYQQPNIQYKVTRTYVPNGAENPEEVWVDNVRMYPEFLEAVEPSNADDDDSNSMSSQVSHTSSDPGYDWPRHTFDLRDIVIKNNDNTQWTIIGCKVDNIRRDFRWHYYIISYPEHEYHTRRWIAPDQIHNLMLPVAPPPPPPPLGGTQKSLYL